MVCRFRELNAVIKHNTSWNIIKLLSPLLLFKSSNIMRKSSQQAKSVCCASLIDMDHLFTSIIPILFLFANVSIKECGKLNEEVIPLVVNGEVVPLGMLPWQAALFFMKSGNWTFWCGGSLINDYAVITAAHCTWKIVPEKLQVVLGKFYRDYYINEDLAQIKQVKQIIIQPVYQDLNGNYGSDLAVLILASPVEFTSVVQPVCIDWELKAMEEDLVEGNIGVVAGWGINEHDTFSDQLHMVKLPIVSAEHCIRDQPKDFKKYVTYTTFCAGYRNGTGVCNGDSGGGLVFPHASGSNSTWLLQGVVSVSPRRRGTSFCDPTYYTVFTKVGLYSKWLQSVLESAQIKCSMLEEKK